MEILRRQIKFVTIYHEDKVKFTGRRTYGQTEADNDNTPWAWKAKGAKVLDNYLELQYENFSIRPLIDLFIIYFYLKLNTVTNYTNALIVINISTWWKKPWCISDHTSPNDLILQAYTDMNVLSEWPQVLPYWQGRSSIPHSHMMYRYHHISNISHTKSPNFNVTCLILQLSLLMYWSQVLSQEWRCNWSSAERRCSNCIWVISNSIAN